MWRTWKSRSAPGPAGPKASAAARLIAQRAEAAAEDQQATVLGGDPEALARGAAVGVADRGRDRAAGEQVARPLAPGDREREADAPRPRAPAARLVRPRWLSASVRTSGRRIASAARPAGAAT